MANISLMEMLASWTQLGVYSHFAQPGDRMQRWFGMQIGGPGEVRGQGEGRLFRYQYFDHTRDAANFRNPGSGPATVNRQAVGVVVGSFGRVHEKLILTYEELGNLRPLELNAPVDTGGQQYMTRQQKYLYERASNVRELATVSALRGGLQLLISGENQIPVFSGGDITINYNVPTTNTGALKKADGSTDIITASWSSASTKIIDQLVDIEQVSEFRTGRPVRHVWCDGIVWNSVLNNTQVQAMGGSANFPYISYEMHETPGPDGRPNRFFEASLKAIPHLVWHVYNSGLNVNGTYTRFYDGTHANFLPDPDPDWIGMGVGSEWVVEYPGQTAKPAQGFFPWGKTSDEPASLQLLFVDNFIPMLFQPACVLYGTVIF